MSADKFGGLQNPPPLQWALTPAERLLWRALDSGQLVGTLIGDEIIAYFRERETA